MSFNARLDLDANRDGRIEADEPGRWDWRWSAEGTGAIVVPDLDQDGAGEVNSELTEMQLVVEGDVPDGVELALSVDPSAASSITIHRERDGKLEPIVGAAAGEQGKTLAVSGPLEAAGEKLLIQGRRFPDISFRGLVEIFLLAAQGERSTITDSVLVRMAPWIMTPNTLEPKRVFAVSLGTRNKEFLEGLQAACDEVSVPLEVIPTDVAGGDQWIQDEIEFGYAQSPNGIYDVVCDGPRNRELDGFAEAKLRGPQLGLVEIGTHLGDASSLDSFGNLEVAPPVTVGETHYPLGRVVLGNRPKTPSNALIDRRPALRLREFLYAQEVQSPFEIHSDWLAVGHIDEIISFVSAPNEIGFELLIASTKQAKEIFDRLASEGHGEEVCWEGQVRIDRQQKKILPADETVNELLAKTELWDFNVECQKHLDGVRADLVRELGLDDTVIRTVPVAFKREADGRALAYFPDMVNHLVLGNLSVVPKPYGPKLDDRDPFEEAFCAAVPHRQVRFIDDWIPYHEASGEVHCGTNTLRKAPEDVRWWEHRLPGMHDAAVRKRA